LKGDRGNSEQGMCPMRNNEEGYSHPLMSDETLSCSEELGNERFACVETEIVMKIPAIEDNDKL
jgi:hypothetical protein